MLIKINIRDCIHPNKKKRKKCLRGAVKSVRTLNHVRHSTDIPSGEITVEGTSSMEHCTTATTKKSPRIKMGWKKKEERALFKNRISAATERRREIETAKKRPDLGERRRRVYVLDSMVVTFPTCQVERSPLKALALSNTAPQQQQRKVQG